MGTKVIVSKAKPPITSIDVIADQCWKVHHYYNKLVELDRAFTAERDDAKRKHIPGLIECEEHCEQLEEKLDELIEKVKAANIKAGKKAASKDDQTEISQARKELKEARERRKELRSKAKTSEPYQRDLDKLVCKYQGTPIKISDQGKVLLRRGGLLKDARKNSGVYPGTYQRIEQSIDQARKTTRNGRVKFREWNGDGIVGPQISPPISVSDMCSGDDSRLILERHPNRKQSKRRQRNGVELVTFHIRVASDDERKPVWAKIKAYLPLSQLPDDAKIRWASIVRRQVGVRRHKHPTIAEGVWLPYYEWQVHLTIDTDDEKERAITGSAGINMGSRTMKDGTIRVAYVCGDDGYANELFLPDWLVERFAKADRFQSERDKKFNAIRDELIEWLDDNKPPEWLSKATESIAWWRSKRKLCRVHNQWQGSRFAGDAEIFDKLTDWFRAEVDLEQYAMMTARRARRARLWLYRNYVAQIRRRYKTVVADDWNIQKLKRNPRAESNDPVNSIAKQHSAWASPGLLRNLFVQDGATKEDSTDITRKCHSCGSDNEWDRRKELWHTCDSCSLPWDQDFNAAKNLLAKAIELSDKGGITKTAGRKGGAWAERKKKAHVGGEK